MANKIVLIGAGSHAQVVLDCLGGKAYGFVDDKTAEFCSLKKLTDIGEDQYGIISFGAVEPKGLQSRNKVFAEYKARGINFTSAIHKSAIIAKDAKIGEGAMIGPGAVINAGAVIGANAIINSAAIIEHDAVIGDGTHVAPGAIVLGAAKVGKTAMIGAGSVILQAAEVPNNSLVKACSRFPR